MIEYSVVPNNATDPISYRAEVRHQGNADLHAIAADVASTNIASAQTVASILVAVEEAIMRRLQNGQNVNLDGFLNFETSISAKFETSDAPLPADYKVNMRVNPSSRFVDDFRADVDLHRVAPSNLAPNITIFKGLFGADPAAAIVGGTFELDGSRLYFDASQDDAGVFLIASDGSETRLTNIQSATESRVQFAIPSDLESGSYSVEVRGRNRGAAPTAPLRTGVAPTPLVVS